MCCKTFMCSNPPCFANSGPPSVPETHFFQNQGVHVFQSQKHPYISCSEHSCVPKHLCVPTLPCLPSSVRPCVPKLHPFRAQACLCCRIKFRATIFSKLAASICRKPCVHQVFQKTRFSKLRASIRTQLREPLCVPSTHVYKAQGICVFQASMCTKLRASLCSKHQCLASSGHQCVLSIQVYQVQGM